VEQISTDTEPTSEYDLEYDEEPAHVATIPWEECLPPGEQPDTTRQGRNLLMLAAFLGAVFVGTIWHFAGRFLDLVFLTPVAAGLGLAFPIGKVVHKAHWRRPRTLIWLSITATFLVFMTRYVEDCVATRPQIVEMVTDHYAEKWHMPASVAHSAVEQGLSPFSTFRLFMVITAYQGVYLSRDMGITYLMSSGTLINVIGLPFRGYGFWFLLILQGVVISWICIETTSGLARAGFCDACGNWAKQSLLFRKQGHQANELLDCVRHQDWAAADEMRLGGKINGHDFSRVRLLYCSQCAEDRLIVNRVVRGEETYLFCARLTKEATASLRAAIRRLN
jgi:hypothetical protein